MCIRDSLTGDLNSGILGPFVNRSQDDIALLNDYLAAAGGLAQPRGLFIQGDGFGQSEHATGGVDPAHTQFLTDKLGVVFRNPTYQGLSGNIGDCAAVSYTHLRAHETGRNLVCRLLLEKKNKKKRV